MPEGRSLGAYPVGAGVDAFALSPGGHRLALPVDRYTLEVRDVGGGAGPRLSTSRSRVHDGLSLRLGEGCSVVRAGKHTHVISWERGPLRVVPCHGTMRQDFYLDQVYGPLISANRAGPGRPNPDRFMASCSTGSITGLVDHLGHVAILDADLATVAIFFSFRNRFAAWLPDGTRLDPPDLIGGPPSPWAEDRMAEALRGAVRRGRNQPG